MSDQVLIGKVTHYYARIGVAALELEGALAKGDKVHILGHTTDFRLDVGSMEIDHRQVDEAHSGDDVALMVSARVRPGDRVYRESNGRLAETDGGSA